MNEVRVEGRMRIIPNSIHRLNYKLMFSSYFSMDLDLSLLVLSCVPGASPHSVCVCFENETKNNVNFFL